MTDRLIEQVREALRPFAEQGNIEPTFPGTTHVWLCINRAHLYGAASALAAIEAAGEGMETTFEQRQRWAAEADELLWRTMEGPYSVIVVLLRDLDRLLLRQPKEGGAEDIEQAFRVGKTVGKIQAAVEVAPSPAQPERAPADEEIECLASNLINFAKGAARKGLALHKYDAAEHEWFLGLRDHLRDAAALLRRRRPSEAVLAEREACAKIADAHATWPGLDTALTIAGAIRSRGTP